MRAEKIAQRKRAPAWPVEGEVQRDRALAQRRGEQDDSIDKIFSPHSASCVVTVPPPAVNFSSCVIACQGEQANGNVTEAHLCRSKMFCPPDLIIRGLRPRDVPEVYKMLNAALKDEEGAELKRQIRFIFMHPAIWILSAVLICAFGISLR